LNPTAAQQDPKEWVEQRSVVKFKKKNKTFGIAKLKGKKKSSP
jgi:hypothetical protein